jgi:hypothetical protein
MLGSDSGEANVKSKQVAQQSLDTENHTVQQAEADLVTATNELHTQQGILAEKTTERDGLKTQLSQLQSQVSSLSGQLSTLQSQLSSAEAAASDAESAATQPQIAQAQSPDKTTINKNLDIAGNAALDAAGIPGGMTDRDPRAVVNLWAKIAAGDFSDLAKAVNSRMAEVGLPSVSNSVIQAMLMDKLTDQTGSWKNW